MTKRPLAPRIKRRIGKLFSTDADPAQSVGKSPASDAAETPAELNRAQESEPAQADRDEKALVAELRASFRRVPAEGSPGAAEWRSRTQELLDQVSPDHIPHPVVRNAARHKLRVGRGLSFKSMMVYDAETRKTLGLEVPSWRLDQKVSAYQFADEIGLRRPEADLQTYRFSDLSFKPSMVVKPRQSTGSKGCYLIYSETDIVHVKDGQHFTSYAGMTAHANSLMRPDKQGRKVPDRWITEELILEDSATRTPARDLKFFCFYGEVALVLEVVRTEGVSKYAFHRPDQTVVTPGVWDYEYFEGDGTTEDALRLAAQVSLEIPHPFCRVDLLKGENGLVFGEFTPRPGGYHQFSDEWDRILGEAWARAQHRLNTDLLAGKRFEPFVRSTGMLDG